MNVVRVLALALGSALVVSCGSTQDKGLEGEGVGSADSAPDVNPDGVPYPTDNIGTRARRGSGASHTSGNRIANFKFNGYLEANVDGGLQPISLAQFYDPTGARYKIIHIQASGAWCNPCQIETSVVAEMKAELDAKKTVWLISLAEGTVAGSPSKQIDLDNWIERFKPPYTHLLDSGNKNLGPFYDRAALPWNADIDATTMEILAAGTGAVTEPAAILREVDAALAAAAISKLKATN